MALALAYQQRRPNLGDLSPEQVTAMQAPTQQPTMSLLDRISETGAGIGKGLANTVEGMGQMVTAPIETGKEMYRNVSDVVSNPSLIADALKQMGEKATSSPAGFGEVVGENINPRNLAKTLAKGLAKPVMQELIVAHGSPHRFPPTANNPLGEFDASKIGTGEGAQAYGHGHYLSESEKTGENYAYKLTDVGGGPVVIDDSSLIPRPRYGSVADGLYHRMKYLNDLKERAAAGDINAKNSIPAMEQSIEELKGKANVYKVDLPDEKIAQMLDWDAPLKEQTHIIGAIDSKYDPSVFLDQMGLTTESKGSDLLYALGHGRPEKQAAASEWLRNLGIPGIKYFDEGSRQSGKGTRNFVVFPGEEKHLKILERK